VTAALRQAQGDTKRAQGDAGGDLILPDHVVAYYEEHEAETYDADATQLMFLIRALGQRLNDVSTTWLEPYGLTPLSFQVLARLQAEPNRGLALSAIARGLHTRAATMTSLIDGLERDGFIKRTAHATDRRATLAMLTAKGSKLVARASRSQHEHYKLMMGGIPKRDRRTVQQTLLAINAGLMREKERLRGATD
jgi:DNA-binding MarR family transcriptional regulator